MATVSVIVPCYNYGRYLVRCVESVLAQRGGEVEVLVIDDASSDDTPLHGRLLANADARVSYLRHDQNRGHIATYNEGLDWASGDYTLLLSADDLLAPDALLRAATLLDRHGDVGFVYGAAVRFTDDPPVVPPRISSGGGWEVVSGREWIEARCRDGDNPVHSPTVVVRTDLQRRLGGYREDLPRSGDMEMWLRFAAHAAVGRLRSVQAYYRVHAASMDRTQFSPLMKLEQTEAAYRAVFQRCESDIPDTDRLQQLANAALARQALWWACRSVYRRDLTTTFATTDFAVRTYRGIPWETDSTSLRSIIQLVAQLPHLVRPLLSGLRTWPRAWLSARLHRREQVVPG